MPFSGTSATSAAGSPSPKGGAGQSRVRLPALFRKTELCAFHEKQRCAKGEACPFAHGREELREAPDLTKTGMCRRWLEGGCPRASQDCPWAHGSWDLRKADDSFLSTGTRCTPPPEAASPCPAPTKPVNGAASPAARPLRLAEHLFAEEAPPPAPSALVVLGEAPAAVPSTPLPLPVTAAVWQSSRGYVARQLSSGVASAPPPPTPPVAPGSVDPTCQHFLAEVIRRSAVTTYSGLEELLRGSQPETYED